MIAPTGQKYSNLLDSFIKRLGHLESIPRCNRIAGVVLDAKLLGLAIDEDKALLIQNNTTGIVFSPTQVLFFTPGNSKNLSIDVYEKNELINLKKYSAF